uniref:Uncharacterized protein n=1 Tax=Panagrolaimus sp. ES5 TaxID=591445 RepID=A0AC34GBB8_9BILA
MRFRANKSRKRILEKAESIAFNQAFPTRLCPQRGQNGEINVIEVSVGLNRDQKMRIRLHDRNNIYTNSLSSGRDPRCLFNIAPTSENSYHLSDSPAILSLNTSWNNAQFMDTVTSQHGSHNVPESNSDSFPSGKDSTLVQIVLDSQIENVNYGTNMFFQNKPVNLSQLFRHEVSQTNYSQVFATQQQLETQVETQVESRVSKVKNKLLFKKTPL